MALVIDAGALYAQADTADPGHAAVRALLTAERDEIVTTELAVAEADYLILDRLGPDVEAAFLRGAGGRCALYAKQANEQGERERPRAAEYGIRWVHG